MKLVPCLDGIVWILLYVESVSGARSGDHATLYQPSYLKSVENDIDLHILTIY